MNDIKTLLEKYYNGATSLDEERRIQEYFALHPEAADTPEAQLSGAIRSLKNDQDHTRPLKPRRMVFRYLALGGTAVAAGLALLIGLQHSPQPQQQEQARQPAQVTVQQSITTLLMMPKVSVEIQDEQQALELARKTLAYMSSKLNKGVTGINHLNKLERSISKIQNKEKS